MTSHLHRLTFPLKTQGRGNSTNSKKLLQYCVSFQISSPAIRCGVSQSCHFTVTSVVAVLQGHNGCVPTVQLFTALADASRKIPWNTPEFVPFKTQEMPAFLGTGAGLK